jgi:6-phosphogluconolactonase (cycloisomerase 2 family)
MRTLGNKFIQGDSMNRKRASLGLGILLLLALAIVGCSSGQLDAILGGGGGFVPVAHAPAVLIAADFDGGTLASFKVDATTGALTEAPGSPISAFGCAWAVAATPNGKFAYVGDQCNGQVEVLSINASTGDLTDLGPTSLANNDSVPWVSSIAITPDSKYLYVSDNVQLNGFSINQTSGALTALPGFPMTLGTQPFSVATSPDGKYVYVSDDSDDTIYGFSVNSSTGALTAIPGSPFPCLVSACDGLTVDGAAKFVYASAQGDKAVQGWKIGTNGALTSVGASIGAGLTPFQVIADPLGRYIYTMNDQDDNYNGYSINTSTGVLTSIAGSPFTASGQPQGGVVDPSGKFVYASDCSNDKITGSSIGAGGALTTLGSMPMTVNNGTLCGGVAITHQ